MSWNYRVIKTKYTSPAGRDEETFSIHEVYYADDKEMPEEYFDKPIMVTQDACGPHGETLKELKKDYAIFRLAFDRDVIDMEYFESEECKKINDIWDKIREEAADDDDEEIDEGTRADDPGGS